MLKLLLILSVLNLSCALPYINIVPQNVITVPPNCPPGQEWINGQCRDIWLRSSTTPATPLKADQNISPNNMITVPPNCPPGQELINGQCRDIWRGGILAESKLFEKLVESFWSQSDNARNSRQAVDEDAVAIVANDDTQSDDTSRNIISVPNQCPTGYKPDALGICRPIF